MDKPSAAFYVLNDVIPQSSCHKEEYCKNKWIYILNIMDKVLYLSKF